MTQEQIDAVARRVVEELAERRTLEAQGRAAVAGLSASLTAAAAELDAAMDHLAAVPDFSSPRSIMR